MNKKILIGIVLVVIGLAIGSYFLGGSKDSFGAAPASGVTETNAVWNTAGIVVGTAKQFYVDSLGNITGTTLTTTGAVSITGASTVGTFTQGGAIGTIATTSTTYTLSASEFDTENVINVTPNGASLTLTLPASSTLSSFVSTAGQVRTVYIRNATTTAAVNITIAGGTGTTLTRVATTSTLIGNTSGSSYGKIDFVRQSDTNISALLTVFN